jgi:ketopantoate reductase
MSGTRHDDTHVEYILDTATWIGPYGGTPFETRAEVAELIVASGLKAEAFDDLRPAQWSKLIFNATVNGVAALTGLPHDFRTSRAPSDRPATSAPRPRPRRRGQGGRRRAGVELHEDPWEMNVLATQRGSAHYPSMLEDVEARRPTEVELITARSCARRSASASTCRCTRRSTGSSRRRRRLLVRVCVVGCGAVGSLFAANLAHARRRRGVGVRPRARARRRDQRDGLRLSGAGDVVGRPRATTDAGELPPCDFGIVATKAMHTEARSPRPRTRSPTAASRPCRTASATRRRSPSTSSA